MSAHAHDGHVHDGRRREMGRRSSLVVCSSAGSALARARPADPRPRLGHDPGRELRRSGGDHRQEPLPAGHARALLVLRGRRVRCTPQLAEAARTDHDLVFFTEHDWRKKGLDHLRRGIHFTGASEFEDPAGTWMWTNRVEGSPPLGRSQWVSSPSSPVEPGHALQVAVTAPANGTAFNLFDGDDSKSSKGVRVQRVRPTALQVDVRADQASANGWFELRLYLSFYPAVGGYPQGVPDA